MILFISSWHLVALLGVFLGFVGFLFGLWALAGMLGILEAVRGEYAARTTAGKLKHEKRSAAAKQGHVTRRAKRHHPQGDSWADATLDGLEMGAKVTAPTVSGALNDDEVERVLRQIDAQAEAKQTDDALRFVQRGEDQ